MSDPSKFLSALTHLNRAPTKFGKAPHKPVLLITLLELMESGQIDVSAWPMDCADPEAMGGRFPAWLHREAGIVKAVVDWS